MSIKYNFPTVKTADSAHSTYIREPPRKGPQEEVYLEGASRSVNRYDGSTNYITYYQFKLQDGAMAEEYSRWQRG